MSASDPTPSRLNLSMELVEAMLVDSDSMSPQSGSQSSSNTLRDSRRVKTARGESSGRCNMSQVTEGLPKSLEHGKSVAVVSTSHASSLASRLSQFVHGESSEWSALRFHSTLEYHDMQSQQVNSGIRPRVFAGMVSEARKMVQESEGRAQALEQLAQDNYKQTSFAFALKSWSMWLKLLQTKPIAIKLPACSS